MVDFTTLNLIGRDWLIELFDNNLARTKETNVAHAPHHPENPLKFGKMHSKRGNMRNGGCSAGVVNIHRLFPKGRHTMNAKIMSQLKDLGITLSL